MTPLRALSPAGEQTEEGSQQGLRPEGLRRRSPVDARVTLTSVHLLTKPGKKLEDKFMGV